MKIKTLISLLGVVLCLAWTPVVSGQTADGSMLYTPQVDLSSGPQNTFAGNVGGVFLTTSSLWPYVNWIGYYDQNGDGLANSHQVAIWRVGGAGGTGTTPDALVTIPAGTAAPLLNGYRWVQLPSTLGLWYGTWYTISAQTDGVDTWGDLISGTQNSWSSQYADSQTWTRAGRYDTAASWPNSPGTQVGTSDSIYPVANLGYNLTFVPEPTALCLLGAGLALFLGARRKS